VTFEILPAIDVAGGRLVFVSSDGVRSVEAFDGSPLVAAETFVAKGAAWLHVVDVDRALGGDGDLELLGSIASLGAAIQASGGIEDRPAADAALEAGAKRVVLGSSLLADRSRLARVVESLGVRTVVGVETDGSVIRPRSGGSDLPLADTLDWLPTVGARRYLYTGLSRVAGLGGPDVERIEFAARALARPVLAAGGIRGVDDVVALRALGPDVVEGVVVGRALYEGLDLADLLAAVA
jgi:phosphoribosylformimino-5-aminoimidazole carboxamide ribonucleotide (ProFAR) isomerase